MTSFTRHDLQKLNMDIFHSATTFSMATFYNMWYIWCSVFRHPKRENSKSRCLKQIATDKKIHSRLHASSCLKFTSLKRNTSFVLVSEYFSLVVSKIRVFFLFKGEGRRWRSLSVCTNIEAFCSFSEFLLFRHRNFERGQGALFHSKQFE